MCALLVWLSSYHTCPNFGEHFYVSGVQAAVNQLSTSLSSASVEGIRKVFDDHAARLSTFKSNVYLAAVIVGMAALLNVAVFILRAVR